MSESEQLNQVVEKHREEPGSTPEAADTESADLFIEKAIELLSTLPAKSPEEQKIRPAITLIEKAIHIISHSPDTYIPPALIKRIHDIILENSNEYEREKRRFKHYEDFEDSVMNGMLPVDELYEAPVGLEHVMGTGNTLRHIFDMKISLDLEHKRSIPKNDPYWSHYWHLGRHSLSETIAKKKQLLLKGAKPKTVLSALGRTLKYETDAPFVDWNKWGKEIRDPRQSFFGKKANFLKIINNNTTVSKGGRKTRKNRR